MSCQINYSSTHLKLEFEIKNSKLNKIYLKILNSLKADPLMRETQELLGKQKLPLGILFCSDQEMRDYNKRYRTLDRTTDVLSFPSKELPQKTLELIPANELSLGDLIFSIPALKRTGSIKI